MQVQPALRTGPTTRRNTMSPNRKPISAVFKNFESRNGRNAKTTTRTHLESECSHRPSTNNVQKRNENASASSPAAVSNVEILRKHITLFVRARTRKRRKSVNPVGSMTHTAAVKVMTNLQKKKNKKQTKNNSEKVNDRFN